MHKRQGDILSLAVDFSFPHCLCYSGCQRFFPSVCKARASDCLGRTRGGGEIYDKGMKVTQASSVIKSQKQEVILFLDHTKADVHEVVHGPHNLDMQWPSLRR